MLPPALVSIVDLELRSSPSILGQTALKVKINMVEIAMDVVRVVQSTLGTIPEGDEA